VLLGQQVRLGRGRDNDIVLRVQPGSPQNDERSARISNHHAVIEWSSAGLTWRNLECGNGTVVNGQFLAAGGKAALQPGLSVSPAGVLPMCCLVSGDGTLRIVRQDGLAGREEYLLLHSSASIGSDPGCDLPIVHPCLAPFQTQLSWRDGRFLLEPALPLAPGAVVRFGEVSITVTAYRQYGIEERQLPTQNAR
jgi:hypothetical protein